MSEKLMRVQNVRSYKFGNTNNRVVGGKVYVAYDDGYYGWVKRSDLIMV